MVNAKVVVSHAADVAARAAVTSLPDGHPENITKAALMALTPLSPKADSPTSDGQDVYSALQGLGTSVADSFPARYAFAQDATKVTWSPSDADFAHSAGPTH